MVWMVVRCLLVLLLDFTSVVAIYNYEIFIAHLHNVNVIYTMSCLVLVVTTNKRKSNDKIVIR